MLLDYLLVENFMKVKRLELALNGPGVYWITGQWDSPEGIVSNGCGKTSALSAMRWAIDGAAKKKHIGPHDRGMKSKVEFSGSDVGGSVEIRRLQRTGSPEVSFLLKGVDRTSDRGAEATDKAISELLKFDWDVLRSLYHVKKSGFFYETDAARKKLLMQFFDQRTLEQITEKISRSSTGLRAKVDELTVKLEGIDGKISGLRMTVEDLKKRIAEAKQRPVVVPDVAGGFDGLRVLKERLELARESYRKLGEESQVKHAARQEAREQLRAWESAAAMYHQERESKKQQLAALREAVDDGVCKACGQQIADDAHISLEIGKYETEILGLDVAMEEARTEVQQRHPLVAQLEADVSTLQQRLQVAGRSLGAAEADVRAREGAIEAAKRPQEPPWTGLEAQLGSTKGQLAEVLAERMGAAGGLKAAAGELEDAEWLTKVCRHDMRVSAFESVADELMGLIRPEVKRLFGKSMDARFAVEVPENGPEKFVLEAEDDGEWRDARETSDGQNARLSLATTFALRRRFDLPFQILMLDEPFAHCDAAVVRRLMPAIEQEAREMQVFIVSHSDAYIPRDGKIIRIRRSGSVIEGSYP